MVKIADKQQCTGCSSCYATCPQSCIEMRSDNFGFVYPIINESKCINCGLCTKSCPILTKPNITSQPMAYASNSKDDKTRQNSTSGGIFVEIAKHVLSNNGVVYGAAYDSEFNVNHIEVSDIEQLGKLQGAKYAQSNLSNTFVSIKNHLVNNRTVLFCGTPCQVAGLKGFLKIDYGKLFCIDFICHGVPSPIIFSQYIDYVGHKNHISQKPININLRDKTSGWRNYSYSLCFEYSDGQKVSVSNNDSIFMKLFVEDYISRASCKNCMFKGYSRLSDITLGDFWGVWDLYPEMDDNKGTSAIIVHSKRGVDLYKAISESIVSMEIALEDIIKYNPYLLCNANPKKDKAIVEKNAINGEFDDIIRYFNRKEKQPLLLRIKNKFLKVR